MIIFNNQFGSDVLHTDFTVTQLSEGQQWLWPSSKRHVPLQGYSRNAIYAAKRYYCVISAGYFQFEADRYFLKSDGNFYSEVSYLITWATSSLPDYQQTASNCDELFTAFFQPRITIFSPMVVGRGPFGMFDTVLLEQSYFGLCDWSRQRFNKRQQGDCVTQQAYFGKACKNLGFNRFPVVNPSSSRGWQCLHREFAEITFEQALLCPRSEKDKCSHLSQFRDFSSSLTAAYPYQYDCQFKVNNSICNNHGSVYPEEQQRCKMHVERFCVCDENYHGKFCTIEDVEWVIEYNPEYSPTNTSSIEWKVFNTRTNVLEYDLIRTTKTEASLRIPGTNVQMRLNGSTCEEYLFGSTLWYDISDLDSWEYNISNLTIFTTSTTSTSTSTTSTTTTTTTEVCEQYRERLTQPAIHRVCLDILQDPNENIPSECHPFATTY